MKAVPWQNVKKDIQNILKQYPCTVTKQEGPVENPDGSVFVDFHVSFKDMDQVSDEWDSIIQKLDSSEWGLNIEENFPSIDIGVVFRY